MFKFKKKYHFVDKCPRCGSYKTGYVVRRNSEKLCNKVRYDGLANGELVETELGIDFGDIDNNVFCRDCGSRWYGEIKIKYLTFEERIEQRELRGIDENLLRDYSLLDMDNFSRKQAIRIINREKKKIEKNKEKAKAKQEKISANTLKEIKIKK